MKSSGAMHVGNQSRVVVIFFFFFKLKKLRGKKSEIVQRETKKRLYEKTSAKQKMGKIVLDN